MKWVLLAIFVWLLYRVGKALFRVLGRLIRWLIGKLPRNEYRPYGRAGARTAWLALAHPMLVAQGANAMMAPSLAPYRRDWLPVPLPDSLGELKPLLLQYFGLRSGTSEEEARRKIDATLRLHWYSQDMRQLDPEDDPRDALAFATARLAFAVRSAALLDWVPESLHWRILQLNAQRAADCFSGWEDFGRAYARGRRQWILRTRPDSFGAAFTEAEVGRWLQSRRHPWRRFDWQMLV